MKKSIAIIGGGAAGIICACHLDTYKYDVTIYEKTSRLGRKLMVAGKGGFNLTHSEATSQMKGRYSPSSFMDPYLSAFSNDDLREWLKSIGVETYVGSSRRVFPEKGIKPNDVFQALTTRIKESKVEVRCNHTWEGWQDESLIFQTEEDRLTIKTDVVIYALGGASWEKTGSDGVWKSLFESEGIRVNSFRPSNCGWVIDWPGDFLRSAEGKPLKNIRCHVSDQAVRGEAMITSRGIEGGAIYALSKPIREAIDKNGSAHVIIDFKPDVERSAIIERLQNRKKSIKETLHKEIKLPKHVIDLLIATTDKEVYQDAETLSELIKHFPLETKEAFPMDEAISTVGGVDLSEMDPHNQLYRLRHNYVIGEMLDWDTITGGYLLQACFSMGVRLARHLNTSC